MAKKATKVVLIVIGVIIGIPVMFIAGIFIHNKIIGPVGWAKANTHDMLKKGLLNPDSMKVVDEFVVQKKEADGTTSINVCGIVDAKNVLGSYTGGVPFASHSIDDTNLDAFDTWKVQMDDPQERALANKAGMLDSFNKVYWNEWCVDANHPALTVAEQKG